MTDKRVIQTFNTTSVIALMNEGIAIEEFQERLKVSNFTGVL